MWLCEINASPAVAEELLPGLVDALIRACIDPICAPNDELLSLGAGVGKAEYSAKAAKALEKGEYFERLFTAAPKEEARY